MINLKKSQFYVLVITFIVITMIFAVLAGRYKHQLNKQILSNATEVQSSKMLKDKIADLKSELKSSYMDNDILINLNNENDRVEKAKPLLAEWIYKHSQVSHNMVNEILDNVSKSSYPLFLLALIKAESNFNPTAVSSKGAMGLGQIMPLHEKALIKANILKEMRDIFNISTAIKATEFVWEMKMSEADGDINKALSMYLGGHDYKYVGQILKDYFQLNYLCKKSLTDKKDIVTVENAVENECEYIKNYDSEDKKIDLPDKEYVYIVKRGDTLSKIAKKAYGETNTNILELIKNSNPDIKDVSFIHVMQKLILPTINIRGTYRLPNVSNIGEGG